MDQCTRHDWWPAMNHDTKPDAGRAASMENPIAEPATQAPNLDAVVSVVKGYYRECCKAVYRSGCPNNQAGIRNAAGHINAMVQACVSLHIATLPAAPVTCCPTSTIDALSNGRIKAGE